MMKKLMKNLSTLALAVIIGVSAFGASVHAEECATYALNKCGTCGTYDISEKSRSVDVNYVNPSEHSVSITIYYTCSKGHEFSDSESYAEGHDYELIEATGKMVCTGCYDSYYWGRISLSE